MKKLFALLMTLTMLLSLATVASADILWEPYENSYYRAHMDDCTGLNKTYRVPEGSWANLYTSPKAGKSLMIMEENTRVYVGFTTEIKGKLWGTGYPIGVGNYEAGWFRLARLQLEFDNDMFDEKFSDQYVEYADQLKDYQVKERIYAWTYPGSGVMDRTIPEINPGYNDGQIDCRYVYADPDGGQWGYVGYYMGRCGWIYLSDPENPNPPVFPQEVENTVTETGKEMPVSGMSTGVVMLLIFVLFIGIVSYTMIRQQIEKKKSVYFNI